MKAMVQDRYGAPGVLRLRDIEPPVAKDDEVLVRVCAASVNPYDLHLVTGTPYLVRMVNGVRRPKLAVPGIDMAGRVEAVGGDVTRFKPGDEVFGMRSGAYAEYVCVRQDRMVLAKPANVTFEQAAAVPLAALTALQGLRDKGRIQSGQRVLVNGAAGGVGTFAVQIAKSFGADVTGVCSTRNVDMVRSIGADRVIDYTREDFVRDGQRYDLILDSIGNHSLVDRKRALSPNGILVAVGGRKDDLWIGPLTGVLKLLVVSMAGNGRMRPMLTKLNRDDLVTLRTLLQDAKVTPVIDRCYPLSEVPQALGYLGKGHVRGKVVITI